MASKNDICRKIESIMPEAGACDRDFTVEYDERNHAWSVDLHRGDIHLKTFVEENEAETCLNKDRCLPLGLQIGQLKRNLELYRQS
ncbi:hypothetical protein [Desulfofustis limnaeus]|uniref:Uncharacterized protein n=1 Tax=Desulfofustis limnaeus TaxID=2740163 RepID=A0ABM7W6A3_9BACT|nr:hypothetical protein [Desulfofustis limnaeus]MDX9896012.1 hypothetical protein [Desulfofustis sp.]BDD86455.1 hypothetical protein DPPLL_08200 [Desulfofustis limnaeus]